MSTATPTRAVHPASVPRAPWVGWASSVEPLPTVESLPSVEPVETTASTSPAPTLRRDRAVHLWVASRFASEAGTTAWTVALTWTAVTTAGPAAAGLVVAGSTLPRALCTLLGGVLADRLDTRRVVVTTNAARVLVHLVGLLLLTLAPGHPLVWLALVTVCFGVADAMNNPASATMSRQVVRDEDLPALLAAMQSAMRLGMLAGAPLGGLLVAAWDVRAAMVLDAVTFALVGLVFARVLRPRFPRALTAGAGWRTDLADGLREVRRNTRLRGLLLALAGVNLFVVPALTVGLALRVSGAGWSAHTLGLLQGCEGLGAVAGAVVALRWRPRRQASRAFALLVVQGLLVAGLGLGGAWATGAVVTAVGVTAGLASAYVSALFVRAADGPYLGRAMSLSSLVDDALMPVAMAGFGALSGSWGVAVTCVVAGVAMALTSGWSAVRLTRADRVVGASA